MSPENAEKAAALQSLIKDLTEMREAVLENGIAIRFPKPLPKTVATATTNFAAQHLQIHIDRAREELEAL